jgi:multidrug efflux pump subunit AcrB
LAVVAFAVILGLLYGSFRRWRLALLAMFTLPMALVGGLLAAWMTSATMTIGSFVGLFTVLGIAARNGILMIIHCQHLEAVEGMTFGPELVIRAARERLAPILMTTLATGLALVPLVVMGDVPGHEIEYPMAIVILGGLTTSTLLNLFVVPSLYLRFGRAKDQLHKAIPHDPVVQSPAPQLPVAELVPTQRSTRGSGRHRTRR